MELEDRAALTRRLLVAPPAEFVARRTAAVRELRGSDRAAATLVGATRKPAPAAWVVDLLAEQGVLDDAVALGPALRAAQEHADPAEIARLRRERRDLVDALAASGAELAADAGSPVGDAVLEQVRATIGAGMSDPRAGAAIRSGLLVRALEAVGFESVDLDGAVALPEVLPEVVPDVSPDSVPPEASPDPVPPGSAPPDSAARARAERDADERAAREADRARARAAAERAVAEADRVLADLALRLGDADDRRRTLEERRADLEHELREVRRALTDAVREREWLAGEHAAAERAAADARSALP